MVEKKKEESKEEVKHGCPWCIKNGKKDSKCLVLVTGRTQCTDCGKHWNPEDLGKTWSLELERGERWARENKARQLTGA